MTSDTYILRIPKREIDVVESGRRARKGRIALDLGRDVKFSTTALESYSFVRWESVIYDAMVVGATIEYGDRIVRRPSQGWTRRISLRIPVHNPDRWTAPNVSAALHDAVEFLTGDYWSISFVERLESALSPSQNYLNLAVTTEAVLAYSDGMDSYTVAGIVGESLGDRLVCVRVGSERRGTLKNNNRRRLFTRVPYHVPCNMPNRESSSRSRGFKFALISAIAAYLTDANEIIVPESGQGVIGPALISVGHAYPDYRNHPFFVVRMQRFIEALLQTRCHYVFPRIWNTKGETLREFTLLSGENDWDSTRSCWRSNRWSSVNGKLRQCGVCAACMLRRVAVHSAGLTESADAYVCTDMEEATLETAVDPDFTRLTPAYREYAIAGVLYMDHLAAMAEEDARPHVMRHATLLAPVLGISGEKAHAQLDALLFKHAEEWKNYMDSLGTNSFVTQWARGQR